MIKQRSYNLEIVRIISFIMVIVIHITNYYCRDIINISNSEYIFSLALNIISRVSVPSFFMISGSLMLNRSESFLSSLKRVKKFFIVLVFWSLLYYFFNIYFMHTECSLKEAIYTPTEAHLWYLYAIIPMYLALPLLREIYTRMTPKTEIFLFVFGIVFLVFLQILYYSLYEYTLVSKVIIKGVQRAFCYVYYFFMGCIISKHRNEIRIKKRYLVLIFIVSMILNISITSALSISAGKHNVLLLPYSGLPIIVASISFFTFFLKLNGGKMELPGRIKKITDLLSVCSFGVYLLHIIFLDVYKKYILPGDVSAFVVVPVLSVLITVLSVLSVHFLRKIPIFKQIL